MTTADSRDRFDHAKWRPSKWLALLGILSLFWITVVACDRGDDQSKSSGSVASASDVVKTRNLSDADIRNALLTYTPSGQKDEYIMFASGGQSGQVFVIGMPSMRMLRTIAVFTPEPWQGFGFGGSSNEVVSGADWKGNEIRWADTHHPALSETKADYDGQYLFINDKANARMAVIDLRDFETKQLVKNPLVMNDHGGTFVTPNTEYIVEGGQYSQPFNGEYAPLDQQSYNDKYKGMITFWKFDRQAGRIDTSKSFSMELPPYWQDLCDAGKGPSEGWVYCNSINTERAIGTSGEPTSDGKPKQFEQGVGERDMDYLHVINQKKAEEIFNSGKTKDVNGMRVIELQTSIDNGLLHFVPEPKSPHGSDVAPKGDMVVVSGKLDKHATVYSTKKIEDAIKNKTYESTGKDPYGVPVLSFDATKEAQVELGLGPLHTQFDNQGYAYTSLFLDSAVARWSLGGERKDGEQPWKLITKTPVQYNIGHLAAAEGDTADPDGKYLVALNKWSQDRFFTTGPLLPQNFQLMDISQKGQTMPVVYDMPIGNGEPHYAQIIKADKLKPMEFYPGVGYDPHKMAVDPNAPQPGNEGVKRDGNRVEINMTMVRSHMTPDKIEVKAGDHVVWHITNVEQSLDATHGFALPGYNISLSLEAGETQTIEFDANQSGVFAYYCSEFCSALHLEMMGYFLVAPS